MSKSTRWCFTLNNYNDDEVVIIRALQVKIVYLVFGYEVAPETGTPHLQGFVIFKSQQRFAAVRKILPRAHWEITQRTSIAAANYCKEDGKFEEFGVLPMSAGEAGGAAEKDRWELARKRAREGNLDEVPSDIYIKYYRTLKEIAKDHMVKPEDAGDVTGVWLYGEPGVGKSRAVTEVFPAAYKKMQNKWWDGYQNEEVVWLDDYDSKELGHLLKIWADRYSFLAETKGGAIHIRPKLFVITSNYPPSSSHFAWDTDLVKAIERRFKLIHVFNYEGLCDRLRAIPLV